MPERDDHRVSRPRANAPAKLRQIGEGQCRLDKVMAIREAIRRNEYDVDELLQHMLAGLQKDLES